MLNGLLMRSARPLLPGKRFLSAAAPVAHSLLFASPCVQSAQRSIFRPTTVLKRLFSSRELNDHDSGHSSSNMSNSSSNHPDNVEIQTALPIKAFYVARSIDFVRLFQTHFADRPHALQRDSVTVALDASALDHVSMQSHSTPSHSEPNAEFFTNTPQSLKGTAAWDASVLQQSLAHKSNIPAELYMVVYGFGSVVFFGNSSASSSLLPSSSPVPPPLTAPSATATGIPPSSSPPVSSVPSSPSSPATHSYSSSSSSSSSSFSNASASFSNGGSHGGSVAFSTPVTPLLRLIREFSVEPIAAPLHDDFTVAIAPKLPHWFELRPGQDTVVVQELDLNNLLVIAGVLRQTVALDHFEKKVDMLVSTFTKLNEELGLVYSSQSGGSGSYSFGLRRRAELFRLVAENNTLMAEILSKTRVLDKSEISWKHGKYSGVSQDLKDEFELEERFRGIDFKMNLVQHNTKFFLELVHQDKSDRLEWIIIILISVEVVLAIMDKLYSRFVDHSDADSSRSHALPHSPASQRQ
ncbi:conserved mitochondrial C-terminal DUF155 domain-containing protein [Andalucia godoyi]|uniref:Conserved mitochondrial C-terminal DUF155 domain-containing protein n=1 Tax=Andalucia godoyi TaxID=505711 RepID=A0A8K0F244_ANDGO|nr:conserved mitochondrial C-terminal DUF155 domain-containing protein [Andalucia godoyi]|eukprot:ANDGO_06990.mRNA.1 conserved mitochondrial C-terminal DUF155 domain-containing protein